MLTEPLPMNIAYQVIWTYLIIMLSVMDMTCAAEAILSVEDAEIEGLPLYFYQEKQFVNFGDYLSLKIVERIVGGEVKIVEHSDLSECKMKLVALGSVLVMARTNDVIWGTGMNGKRMDLKSYKFTTLDVRAVRGPMTRDFIVQNFDIECSEVYGDPALLLPYLFPEFKKKQNPKFPYIIIPHYSEIEMFPKSQYPNVVYPTERWSDVIRKILDSEFVISSSLHGIIVAEAYGIPARYLRITDHEPLFKYQDYYLGTERPGFSYATSVEDALYMGGEPPFKCNLQELYESFPFEYWPNANIKHPDFSKTNATAVY